MLKLALLLVLAATVLVPTFAARRSRPRTGLRLVLGAAVALVVGAWALVLLAGG